MDKLATHFVSFRWTYESCGKVERDRQAKRLSYTLKIIIKAKIIFTISLQQEIVNNNRRNIIFNTLLTLCMRIAHITLQSFPTQKQSKPIEIYCKSYLLWPLKVKCTEYDCPSICHLSASVVLSAATLLFSTVNPCHFPPLIHLYANAFSIT